MYGNSILLSCTNGAKKLLNGFYIWVRKSNLSTTSWKLTRHMYSPLRSKFRVNFDVQTYLCRHSLEMSEVFPIAKFWMENSSQKYLCQDRQSYLSMTRHRHLSKVSDWHVMVTDEMSYGDISPSKCIGFSVLLSRGMIFCKRNKDSSWFAPRLPPYFFQRIFPEISSKFHHSIFAKNRT